MTIEVNWEYKRGVALMLCEQCKQRPATVHLTKIINNEKTELNLCEVCAQQSGMDWGMLFEPNFSLQHLLAGMVENDFMFGKAPAKGPVCSECGLTLADFRQIGQLGCAKCYEAFGGYLEPLFRRVQGSLYHTGKVPKRTGGKVRVWKDIESLRIKLQEAVRCEDYEQAAKLRDEIRRLEKELG